jgi:hypothetical protein
MFTRILGIALGAILAYAVTKTFVNSDFDLHTLLASYAKH